MKKNKILGMLLSVVLTMPFFMACGSDDAAEYGNNVAEKLVGVWKTTMTLAAWKCIELRSDGTLYFNLKEEKNGEIRGTGLNKGQWHYSEEGQTLILYASDGYYTYNLKVAMADDGKAWTGYGTGSRSEYTYTFIRLEGPVYLETESSEENGDDNDEQDTDNTYNIEGIWQGTIIGNYYADRYGTTRTDYDTEIRFYQNGVFSRGGTGYEIDRESWTGRISQFDFEWRVRDGRIYITYDDGYRVVIRDWETYYVGNTMRFRGYFDDYETGEQMASFNLVKVSEQYSY